MLNDFENASWDLLGNSLVATTLTDYSPIISPMSHNLPFLSQWLMPKSYLLDSSAQRVQVLRLTNASCAKGCKKSLLC